MLPLTDLCLTSSLFGRNSGKRFAYEIQESADNVTFVTYKVTPDCRSTYAHGKPAGTKLYFRGHICLSDKKGGAQAYFTTVIVYTK